MGLAQSVRNLKSGHIHMVTLPVRYAPADRNRVQPIEAKAAMVWAALRADKPIPAAAVQGSAADKVDAGKVVGARLPACGHGPSGQAADLQGTPNQFGWGIIPLPTWFWEMRAVLADWSAGPGSRDAHPRERPGALPNLGAPLKREIHPEYVETQVTCTCGATFTTRSTATSGHDPRRGLLRVPPVLHGQAEDPRHRRPRRPLREALRQAAGSAKK